MSRIKFSQYDTDHSLMVLVIPKEQLAQIGIDETTQLNVAFYEGDIRIFKPRDVGRIGVEIE